MDTSPAKSMTQLLEGKPIKEKLLIDAKAKCTSFVRSYGVTPKLVALKVGREASGDMYFAAQAKACQAIGAQHEIRELSEKAPVHEVRQEIQNLNADDTVDGIIIQMPLPKHIPGDVPDDIFWAKDVEGMTAASLGLLLMNRPYLYPCTPAACVELIKASRIDLYGKEVVVVGASVSVGKPIAILLMDQMATVTVCRSSATKAGTLAAHVKRADVLVAALGQPEAIRGEWIKEGAVVIDVGINRLNGKTVGDVQFEEAEKRASAITPVPGGVGPVTTAILMKNLVKAAELRRSFSSK